MRRFRETGVDRLHSRKLGGFDDPAFRDVTFGLLVQRSAGVHDVLRESGHHRGRREMPFAGRREAVTLAGEKLHAGT